MYKEERVEGQSSNNPLFTVCIKQSKPAHSEGGHTHTHTHTYTHTHVHTQTQSRIHSHIHTLTHTLSR
jgi:hypothetical protein